MTDQPRDPLLVEREKTHGDFRITAKIAQDIKAIIHNYNMKGIPHRQMEALDLIATKIARILSGNNLEKDTWTDIAGYAKLGSEACD